MEDIQERFYGGEAQTREAFEELSAMVTAMLVNIQNQEQVSTDELECNLKILYRNVGSKYDNLENYTLENRHRNESNYQYNILSCIILSV